MNSDNNERGRDSTNKPSAITFFTRLAVQFTEGMPKKLRLHGVLLSGLLILVVLVSWLHEPAANASLAAPSAPAAVASEAATSKGAAESVVSASSVSVKAAPVWQTYMVVKGDTLSGIFQKQGFDAATLQQVMRAGKAMKSLRDLRPGEVLKFQKNDQGQLQAISYALGDLDTLVAEADANGWQAKVRRLNPTAHTVVRSGKVNGPLSLSLRATGIPADMAATFVDIFRWKVDFRRDMRPGATFVVIYQQLMHDGKEVGQGPIEAAELTNAGDTLRVYRYEDGKGSYNYYTAKGHSLKPSILRTPVNYTRVSSTFSRSRFNPVLHIWRPHYGVDLAAPIGTPIKAAADGVVKYVGWSSGYGRLVELDNVGAYSTRYGHMSRFARGLRKGDHVRQGEVIGYVGESGVATGPHLHYEIRVHGKPYPPLKVKLPDSAPLPKKYMADFERSIQPLLAVLEAPDSDSSRQRLAALDEQPLTTASIAVLDDDHRDL
jgi:murein DD-endopeptidase MepM/ murein hydrolase activator NlpD